MGVSYMAFGFAGAPALGWVGRRTGKRSAMFLALGIALAAFGGNWFWFNPSHPWLQLIGTAAGAFGTSGFFMLSSSVGADIIDYDELVTGTRREGAFSACSSWINKAGNASGYFIAGQILTLIGFDAGLVGHQSAHTILWMRIFLSMVPVAGIGLAMILLWRFSLTKEKAQEIRALLEERRGRV
jgi:GPH family glycoside/pentoside/hexuronide:cation symporter